MKIEHAQRDEAARSQTSSRRSLAQRTCCPARSKSASPAADRPGAPARTIPPAYTARTGTGPENRQQDGRQMAKQTASPGMPAMGRQRPPHPRAGLTPRGDRHRPPPRRAARTLITPAAVVAARLSCGQPQRALQTHHQIRANRKREDLLGRPPLFRGFRSHLPPRPLPGAPAAPSSPGCRVPSASTQPDHQTDGALLNRLGPGSSSCSGIRSPERSNF